MEGIVFGLVVAAVVLLAIFVTRMNKAEKEAEFSDMGNAILEFGRAYPQEAIRDCAVTFDGNVVFIRLHDAKSGLMKAQRNHYTCHLIEPGTAQIEPVTDPRGLKITFSDTPHNNGVYIFKTAEKAAEVSVWLLGGMAARMG